MCVSLYLRQFISLERDALLSWHEKEQVLSCCQDMLLPEPCLPLIAQLWLYVSDVVTWMHLWMRIDPFGMFVFASDILLFVLVIAS